MQEYVTIQEIGDLIGLDRSNIRKYAIKNGFEFVRIRTIESKGQQTLALTKDDADALVAMRQESGFAGDRPVSKDVGVFYVVQPVPEFDPLRIKLGWSSDMKSRLGTYKTISPNANILSAWPCKIEWESTAIVSITRQGCARIGDELFECENLEDIIERGDAFFSLMPVVE